jgi:hypothetical protein
MYRMFTILSTSGGRIDRRNRCARRDLPSDPVFFYYRGECRATTGRKQMIEVAQLNDLAIRVSGFKRREQENRSVFNLVVLIPGETASDEVTSVLSQRPLTLTLFLETGERETHSVSVNTHEIEETGNPASPVYRHQIELIERSPDDAPDLNEIEEELAAIMARFERLLDALDRLGVVKRDVVEDRVAELIVNKESANAGR